MYSAKVPPSGIGREGIGSVFPPVFGGRQESPPVPAVRPARPDAFGRAHRGVLATSSIAAASVFQSAGGIWKPSRIEYSGPDSPRCHWAPAVCPTEQRGPLASPRRNMPSAVSARNLGYSMHCIFSENCFPGQSCRGTLMILAFFTGSPLACSFRCWSKGAGLSERPRRACRRRRQKEPRTCVRGQPRRRRVLAVAVEAAGR